MLICLCGCVGWSVPSLFACFLIIKVNYVIISYRFLNSAASRLVCFSILYLATLNGGLSILKPICFILKVPISALAYRKHPKNSDTRKICGNPSKILTRWFNYSVMCPKAGRMANSVDPDQTDPSRNSLIWVYIFCAYLTVQTFRIIRICGIYRNIPKFSDRQRRPRSDCSWTSLIRVYTVCHSVCIFWTH